jgi:hypothetical protein
MATVLRARNTDENIFPVYARGFDTVINFLLVVVAGGSIDVTVSALESNFYGILDLVRFGLLCHPIVSHLRIYMRTAQEH